MPDPVIVVGAGLGGLAAAAHLAGRGLEVLVLEAGERPGGRCGALMRDGYHLDTGPTVLTMPEIVDATFAACSADRERELPLIPLDPSYRVVFDDGSRLDVRRRLEDTREGIVALAGEREARGFDRLVERLRDLAEAELPTFIDRPWRGLRDLVQPRATLRIARLGGARRLYDLVAGYVRDPRLRRVFTFQGLYAGVSPFEALGMLGVIAYMDTVRGVVFPRGGMSALPHALARSLVRAGVGLRYGARAERVLVAGGRAAGVRLAGGETLRARAIVLNPDLPTLYGSLLPADWAPGRLNRARYSPSAVVVLAGVRRSFPGQAHHTIRFGPGYRATMDALASGREQSREDLSILVSCPSATDPALAPEGAASLTLLAPCPPLDGAVDWDEAGPHLRAALIRTAEERLGMAGLEDAIEVERTLGPPEWSAMGMARGTPFSLSHTLGQSAALRPGQRSRRARGLYFVGCGTSPGVGVPMVLMGGRHVAELVAEDLTRSPAGSRRQRSVLMAPDGPRPQRCGQ